MPQIIDPIKIEVTLEDQGSNGDGDFRLKFEAPQTQRVKAMRCGFLDNQQCILMVAPTDDAKMIHLAVATINTFSIDFRTGGTRIGFLTDIKSVNGATILDLALNYAGVDKEHQHTFFLKVVSEDDILAARKQRKEQANMSDEEIVVADEREGITVE